MYIDSDGFYTFEIVEKQSIINRMKKLEPEWSEADELVESDDEEEEDEGEGSDQQSGTME